MQFTLQKDIFTPYSIAECFNKFLYVLLGKIHEKIEYRVKKYFLMQVCSFLDRKFELFNFFLKNFLDKAS